MDAIITLTTDFGLTSGYAAAMKGVMLGINPKVRFVDICHAIKPQDIHEAAFVLSMVYRFFPEKTIHVVVVDPGVGSERRAIILRTPVADFVAPDNGVLSYVMQSEARQAPNKVDSQQVELRSGIEAVAITRSECWLSPVSPTFHGRDIFAPVAARLSLGFPLAEFGEPIKSLSVLPLSRPNRSEDGSLVGQVIYIDSFGNLITDIRDEDLAQIAGTIAIEVSGQVIPRLSRTYNEGEGLLALFGSSGYLEVSLRDGNAHVLLGALVGDEVRVKVS